MQKKLLTVTTTIILAIIFSQNCFSQLPATITFERMVVQQNNGENGKAITTFYFTINGDYAMIKREADAEDEKATILYTKDGQMCMIDENEKTIMIMNMPKMMGNAGVTIKKELDKNPLPKAKDDKMTITKTGKTKLICGYTAYEYQMKNEDGNSSWWHAQVDFNPIKIYTMGAGSGAMAQKMKDKKESLKNNFAAIPVLNQNYLMAEIEAGGKTGLETKIISKTTFTFSTAGYSIKEMKGFH